MPEIDRISRRSPIIYLMQVILILYAISSLLFGAFITFFELIIILFLIEVPFIAEQYLLISIPFNLKSAIAIFLTFHMLGNIEHWYYVYYPYFDKIAHFFAGLILALLIFIALIVMNFYKRDKWNKSTIAALIILVSIPFALIWEIGEMSIDAEFIKEMRYSKGFSDTAWDIFFDLSGSILIAFYAYISLTSIHMNDIYSKIIKRKLFRFSAHSEGLDQRPK
jgi:hypothetical protein